MIPSVKETNTLEANTKAKYIQGYWRGKQPETETNTKIEQDNALIAVVLLLGILALAAVLFWQVTLTVLAFTAFGYAGHVLYQKRSYKLTNGLRITYMAQKARII